MRGFSLWRTLFATALLAATCGLGLDAQERVIAPQDASQYVGQTVTVEGVVTQVSTSRRSATTFLNFRGRYPNHAFTAVIFRSATARFPNPSQWEGRRVRVTGRVRDYRGKPEVVLESPEQLRAADR